MKQRQNQQLVQGQPSHRRQASSGTSFHGQAFSLQSGGVQGAAWAGGAEDSCDTVDSGALRAVEAGPLRDSLRLLDALGVAPQQRPGEQCSLADIQRSLEQAGALLDQLEARLLPAAASQLQ